MPRKAKEKDVELNNKIDEKKTAKTAKKTIATKKETTTKKSATVKTTTKRSANSAKTDSKKDTKITKSTKTVETKSATKSKSKKVQPIVEYYDLPFRYNQTVVKILAQTPNVLFIYWDISDEDRKIYEKEYGSNFFEKTRPYLIITNKTKNYTFEVEINDFANSWYLQMTQIVTIKLNLVENLSKILLLLLKKQPHILQMTTYLLLLQMILKCQITIFYLINLENLYSLEILKQI